MRNNRGLAAYPPGRASMKIGPYRRRVSSLKNMTACTLLSSPALAVWKFTLHPSLYLNMRRILLKGARSAASDRSAPFIICANRRPTDTALSLMPYLRRKDQRPDHSPSPQRKMEIAAAKGSSLSPMYCKSIFNCAPVSRFGRRTRFTRTQCIPATRSISRLEAIRAKIRRCHNSPSPSPPRSVIAQ